MRSTRNKSDSHAGQWPKGNVHETQSSGMEFESQQVVVATRLTPKLFNFWHSNGNLYLTRNTRNNSDFHAGAWPRGNVHGTQSSGMEFESQQVVVATRLTSELFYFWHSNGNLYLIRNTRKNSDFHAGAWPRGNVHGTQSSGIEFEPRKLW